MSNKGQYGQTFCHKIKKIAQMPCNGGSLLLRYYGAVKNSA